MCSVKSFQKIRKIIRNVAAIPKSPFVPFRLFSAFFMVWNAPLGGYGYYSLVVTDRKVYNKINKVKHEKEDFKNELEELTKEEHLDSLDLDGVDADLETLKDLVAENPRIAKKLQTEITETETKLKNKQEELKAKEKAEEERRKWVKKQRREKEEAIKRQRMQESQQTPKVRTVTIDVDPEKGFYRKKDLNEDEVDYLIRHGYTISSHVPVGEIREEEFLLKPNRREGEEHFFLVKSIEEYLRPLSREVKVFLTVKPDVVFETPKGKQVAVEVETGTMLRKGKDVIRDKVKELNKNYGKKWFFVVTDRKYAHKYREFGRTYTRKSVARKIKTYFNSCNLGRKKTAKNVKKSPTKK